MGGLKMWSMLISPVTNLVTEILKSKTTIKKHKTQLKKAETSLKKTEINAKKDILTATQKWENIQASNSGKGWRFDYTLIFLTFPVLLIFFSAFFYNPWLVNIELAFKSMLLMPEHWQEVMFVAILASFGVKGLQIFKK